MLWIQGLWDIAPSRLLNRHFKRSQCIHLQGPPVQQQSLCVFTLLGLLELGAEGTTILQTVRNYFSIYTVSNPRRLAYSHLYILQSFRNRSCLVIFKKGLINQYLRTHSFSSQYLLTPFPLSSLLYFLFIHFSLIIYRLIIRYDTTFQHNDYSFRKQN